MQAFKIFALLLHGVTKLPATKKIPATQNDGNGCPLRHAATIATMKAIKWNRRPKTMKAIVTPFQSVTKKQISV